MDLGKHERALENETILDKVLGYADRLQEQFCGIPQLHVRKYLNLTSHPCLPMGWALKSSPVRRTRFTEKQKDYLTSKFRTGETTGQKADAASVAKYMMTAKDSNVNRLFTSSEFLTGQQVSSFFPMTESGIEENHNVEDEEASRKLRSETLQEVALRYPICYDSFNISELIADFQS